MPLPTPQPNKDDARSLSSPFPGFPLPHLQLCPTWPLLDWEAFRAELDPKRPFPSRNFSNVFNRNLRDKAIFTIQLRC